MIILTKVVKLYLISEQINKEGQKIDYQRINSILWDLQKQTRDIKNRTVQLCWEWMNFSSDYCKTQEEYPKERDILGYTLEGYVYDYFKTGYDLYTGNISTSSREVCSSFKNVKKEILKGERSILSYKANQPLDLHKKAISLEYDNFNFFVKLKLLNRTGKKKYDITEDINFKIQVNDKSTRTILERCYDKEYKISGSKLIYEKKKKLWRLNLCYSFENSQVETLEKDKILGIDLGIVYPLMASIYGEYDRFSIKGGEIEEFRRRTEARKRSILQQTKYCGNGRIGHGRNKRTQPAYKINDKIARFRDTANHKYSRALIEYAVKKNCGTIQMENLTGISDNTDCFLKDWSYYDLQTKIENKAKEMGIKVVYIKAQYTSQRCSKCGYIDVNNRIRQALFKCQNCGYETNADYNASQNIGMYDIENIIEETSKIQSANVKQS